MIKAIFTNFYNGTDIFETIDFINTSKPSQHIHVTENRLIPNKYTGKLETDINNIGKRCVLRGYIYKRFIFEDYTETIIDKENNIKVRVSTYKLKD